MHQNNKSFDNLHISKTENKVDYNKNQHWQQNRSPINNNKNNNNNFKTEIKTNYIHKNKNDFNQF